MDAVIKGYPYAKAAVEFAAYDHGAQQAGGSAHALLGGASRLRVPAHHSIGLLSVDDAAREAAEVAEEGIRTLKIKVGVDPARDIAVARGSCCGERGGKSAWTPTKAGDRRA
jgi:muconate cycloisomerase